MFCALTCGNHFAFCVDQPYRFCSGASRRMDGLSVVPAFFPRQLNTSSGEVGRM